MKKISYVVLSLAVSFVWNFSLADEFENISCAAARAVNGNWEDVGEFPLNMYHSESYGEQSMQNFPEQVTGMAIVPNPEFKDSMRIIRVTKIANNQVLILRLITSGIGAITFVSNGEKTEELGFRLNTKTEFADPLNSHLKYSVECMQN